MRVLGIDPGFERLGIAVVEKVAGKREQVLFSECFKTKATLPFPERLRLVGERVAEILAEYQPDHAALESLFFTTNRKTAMHVAEARGVIQYECARAGMPLSEYTPGQIKVAVAGDGAADKVQVMKMVPLLAILAHESASDDELDAVAVALTALAILR
jgi:crossover junction endodeoxyribonuclease RuvC